MSCESLEFNDAELNIPVKNVVKLKNKSRRTKSSDSDLESDSFLNYNLKFDAELEDKPEVLSFISRLQDVIKKQAKKIKKLKTNLKQLKKGTRSKKDVCLDVAVQVNINSEHTDEFKSITEEITEAAENALQQNGFVYEATSGMYYDYNTGYYYNAELGLYYDGNSGTYLIYNKDTQKYEFHSRVDVVSTKPIIKEAKLKRKKQHNDQVKNYSLDGLLRNFSQLSVDHSRTHALDLSKAWPPCMRIILKETTIEKLKIGSLFIITCDGGKIGREGDVSILIPDINVSKTHAEITYDKVLNKYMLIDLGSQNGTILNGKRISGPKQTSEPQEIVHGSIIQFGTTKMLCHIHDGQKTCGHCEPGLVQAETETNIPTISSVVDQVINKNTQYKKELRRIKKKFGLENERTVSNPATGYSDRAGERRKKVGSHSGKEKTQIASLEDSIAKENKGFKMLEKMGWSEGQPLGKDGLGLTEPIRLVSNPGTTGLGGTPSFPSSQPSTLAAEKRNAVWKITQQRYNLVQEINLNAFNLESSSDNEEEVVKK